MTNYGGSAEAGATLRVSRDEQAAAERLKDMGVGDGADFGERGRWYLFAAASGRAVGLNMLHSDSGWDRAGWTTDPTSALIGDAQVGVGWRKGAMQTSFGYIHREVKGQHMICGVDPKPTRWSPSRSRSARTRAHPSALTSLAAREAPSPTAMVERASLGRGGNPAVADAVASRPLHPSALCLREVVERSPSAIAAAMGMSAPRAIHARHNLVDTTLDAASRRLPTTSLASP